mmetsp:Transcript_1914/g.7280  ORF Transcript_1914/g.7280 Transcript_1914/m.7280 type:complete len:170 (-) Transcript_1914:6365-6874(-)
MGFLFPGSVRYGVSEQSFRCGQSKSEGRWRFRKSVLLVQKSRSEGDRNSEAHHGRRSRRDSESDLNVEALTSELRSLGPRARSDVVLYKRFHQAIEVCFARGAVAQAMEVLALMESNLEFVRKSTYAVVASRLANFQQVELLEAMLTRMWQRSRKTALSVRFPGIYSCD